VLDIISDMVHREEQHCRNAESERRQFEGVRSLTDLALRALRALRERKKEVHAKPTRDGKDTAASNFVTSVKTMSKINLAIVSEIPFSARVCGRTFMASSVTTTRLSIDSTIVARSLCLFLALTILAIGSFGQTAETFDIAAFKIPAGWKPQVKPGAVTFTIANEQKGTFAMMTLYRSGESSGSATTDFENDWREFIAGQLGVKEKPQVEPPAKGDGWESVTGATDFKSDLGPSVVVLNTFSGHGKSLSISAVFNNEDYLPAIGAFVSSIKLDNSNAKTESTPQSPENSSIVGAWGISTVVAYTAATSYNGTAGYTVRQYSFNADGTYSFAVKTFSFFHDKLMLIRESGNYEISGTNVTVNPQKSVAQAWSKKDNTDKWGKLLTTQNRPLEKVTYQFTKHYFSGIQQWNLVLQSGKPTQRDGPFSNSQVFDNAWIYSPPCAQCVLELP
jgi:hypothetical protein